MGDEGHVNKIMLTIRIKKFITVIFTVMLTCSSCTNAQTFVVTDIAAPDIT